MTAAVDDHEPEPQEPTEKGYITSNRGILESNLHVLPSTTRSVHFSLDTIRQTRGSTLGELRGAGNSQTNSAVTAVESISPPLGPTQEPNKVGESSSDQPRTSGQGGTSSSEMYRSLLTRYQTRHKRTNQSDRPLSLYHLWFTCHPILVKTPQ